MFQFYLTKILNQTFLHDSHWGFFTFWVTLAQGAPPDAGKRHQGFATSLLTHPRQPDIARLLPMFKGKLTFSFFADIKVVFVLLEAFCQLSSIVLEPKVCIKYRKHWNCLCRPGSFWQHWKKDWTDYEQLLRVDFSCFQSQNIFIDSLKKYCIIHT